MKVILAIDDSVYSQSVCESVARRHWPDNTQFKILTVLAPLSPEGFENDEWAEIVIQANDRRRKYADKYCSTVREKLESKIPNAKVHYEIKEGDPREKILDAAAEWSADRILLGAHSQDVCPRNLIGSVSRTVALHAPCSIEIMRPKRDHKQKSDTVARQRNV